MRSEKEIRKMYNSVCEHFKEHSELLLNIRKGHPLYETFLQQNSIIAAQKAMLEYVLEINE